MDRKFTTLAKSLRSYLILGLLALCLTLAACDGDAPAEPAALPPAVDDMATTGPTPVAATTDQPSRQVATDTTTEVSPLITPTPFESPLMLPEGLNEGYIAFHSDQTGTLQIHSIDLESGLERQLTLPLALTEPDPITVTQGLPQVQRSFEPFWSPDCEQIVFTSERNKPGNFNVYVMNRDGSEQRPLLPDQDTPLGMLNWAPALSPTGDVVAYQTNQEGDLRICFVGIEGNPLGCYAPGYNTALPAWSPDGNRLLFIGIEDGDWDIMIADFAVQGGQVELSDPVKLTDNTIADMHPRMSPDGQYIVFDSNPVGNFDIMIMRTDGSDLRRLSFSGGNEVMPDWRGTSEVIYTGENTGENVEGSGETIEGWGLLSVDINTGAQTTIKSTDALNKWPVWCNPQ